MVRTLPFVLLCTACGSMPADSESTADITESDARMEADVEPPSETEPHDDERWIPPAEDLEIIEAVFRYQFEHNASGQQKNARVFCLSVGGVDAPSELLQRLSDIDIVRPASSCESDMETGVHERASGAQGLTFRVGKVTRRDETHAFATGGYYEAGLSASGNTYDVELKDGTWTVVHDTMHWIA